MMTLREVKAVVFGLTLLVSCLMRAGDWPAIDPAELQIKELPEQPGAAAFVLFHEEIDDDQKHTTSLYYRIKVLNESGRKYADVEIPYYKQDFSVRDIQARTIHADGTVVEFQGKPLEKTVIKRKGVSVQEKILTLPDVQPGSILEYRFSLHYQDDEVYAPHWILQDDMFQRKEHFKFISTSASLRWEYGAVSYTWKLPPGVEIKNNKGTFELELKDVPAFEEEEHMPPTGGYRYSARFYYRRMDNVDQYWKDVGKVWREQVEQYMNKKGAASTVVQQITLPTDTPEQKLKKIYAYTSRIDNLSYKPKLSEKEQKAKNLKDRNVEDILRQQAGDNMDITMVFVALARAAGIPARLMWVADRSDALFDKVYLSLSQFDAFLAVVEVNKQEVFLDPGTKFCPYGLLYWGHSNTTGLKETENGAELDHTPRPQFTEAVVKRVARLKLADNGTMEGPVGVGYFGQEALDFRLRGAKTDDAGRTKLLEDEMKSWLPANAEVSVTHEPNWNDMEAPFGVEYKISAPVLISAGKRVLLPTNVFQFGQRAMFALKERKYPVYLDYPAREIDDVRVKLPESLQIENLPSNETNKVDYALYKVERSQEKNELVVKRDFVMAAFYFQPTDYSGLKAFYDKAREGDEQQALMKQVSNVAKQ